MGPLKHERFSDNQIACDGVSYYNGVSY